MALLFGAALLIGTSEYISVFPTGCGKIRGKKFKKMLTPPFPQKLFTFVKQFILEFEEIPRIRGKLETLVTNLKL